MFLVVVLNSTRIKLHQNINAIKAGFNYIWREIYLRKHHALAHYKLIIPCFKNE